MKTSSNPVCRFRALIALSSFAVCSLAQATTLLNEKFDSGIPSNWKTIESDQAAVNASSTPVSSLAGSGGALRHTGTQHSPQNGAHYSQFAATTLAKTGDTLTMNFNMQGTSTAYAENNGNLFTFGLLGSTMPAFSIGNTFGYGMSTNLQERSDRATTAPVARVMNGTVASATTFTADSDRSVGTAYSLYGGNRMDLLSFTFSITRMADDGLQLIAVFSNVTDSVSFSRTYSIAKADLQNSASPYTFDTVFIGFLRAGSGNTTIFDIDNVNVSFTSVIPEPTTVAILLGLAGLAVAAGWRRMRG